MKKLREIEVPNKYGDLKEKKKKETRIVEARWVKCAKQMDSAVRRVISRKAVYISIPKRILLLERSRTV